MSKWSICFTLFLIFGEVHSQTTYDCDQTANCGCSKNAAVVSRIVGGEAATSFTWSWMVSIAISSALCGGSIIGSEWVITAAHCVNNVRPSLVRVYAGSTNRFSGSQFSYASQIIVHSAFNRNTFENDIALIRLQTPFHVDGLNISMICLPDITAQQLEQAEWPPINTSLVAIGWGRLSTYGNLPPNLQQVTIQAVDFRLAACSDLATNINVQFCAAYPGSGKDTCYGDSGGPLMFFDSNKRWVLAGLTSSGADCASIQYSAIYTRVAAFTNWIESYTNPTTETTAETTTINEISTTKTPLPVTSQAPANHFHNMVTTSLLIFFYFSAIKC